VSSQTQAFRTYTSKTEAAGQQERPQPFLYYKSCRKYQRGNDIYKKKKTASSPDKHGGEREARRYHGSIWEQAAMSEAASRAFVILPEEKRVSINREISKHNKQHGAPRGSNQAIRRLS
jgi:hypothetical protein